MTDRHVVVTPRLRLVRIDRQRGRDLWLVLSDPAVAASYRVNPTLAAVEQTATAMAKAWQHHGVHKWLAYDRATGDVVGRGGCSRVPVDADWGRLYAFLPEADWVREAHPHTQPVPVHANWVEIGWALRRSRWGRGYATEIGRAGLEYAFTTLGVRAVVSCTEPGNVRSRSVMERLGMEHAGQIGGEPIEGIDDHREYVVYTLTRTHWLQRS